MASVEIQVAITLPVDFPVASAPRPVSHPAQLYTRVFGLGQRETADSSMEEAGQKGFISMVQELELGESI